MVSVIIPMYNAEKTILKSLESVRHQTYKGEFEIIVVNDGSTDASAEVVQSYINQHLDLNIQLIHQENKGVSAARNAALKICKGDYISLLDSDDIWLPHKTERQLTLLKNQYLKIDFLASKRQNHQILYPYQVQNDHLAELTFRKIMFRNEAQPSTVVFKRKVLENTGFFDSRQRYAEDINYWLKISLHNKMYILDEELIIAGDGKRTFGVSGLSGNLPQMERGFTKNLKEMYSDKRITFIEYVLYRVFYKAKYVFRLSRDQYLKMKGK